MTQPDTAHVPPTPGWAPPPGVRRLGHGEHTYTLDHQWAKLPEGKRFGYTHGIVQDRAAGGDVRAPATIRPVPGSFTSP